MKRSVKPQDSRMQELLRSKLKSVINLRHELARLEASFAPYYSE
jgi:hypothetical protein